MTSRLHPFHVSSGVDAKGVRFQVYDYTCCCIARSTQGLSLSCGRLTEGVSWNWLWATHGLPCRALVYRGCPCGDPPACHRVQGDAVAKRQPFLVWWLVFAFHGHVQLRILTLLLDWKRCPSSQSSPYSVLRIISTKFFAGCGCSLQLVILFEISSNFSCCFQCRNPSCSRKCEYVCFSVD